MSCKQGSPLRLGEVTKRLRAHSGEGDLVSSPTPTHYTPSPQHTHGVTNGNDRALD